MILNTEKRTLLILGGLSILVFVTGVFMASFSFDTKIVGTPGPARIQLFGLSPENTNFLFRALPLCVGFSYIWFSIRIFLKSFFKFLDIQFPNLKLGSIYKFLRG